MKREWLYSGVVLAVLAASVAAWLFLPAGQEKNRGTSRRDMVEENGGGVAVSVDTKGVAVVVEGGGKMGGFPQVISRERVRSVKRKFRPSPVTREADSDPLAQATEAKKQFRFSSTEEAVALSRELLEEGSDETVGLWVQQILDEQDPARRKAIVEAVKFLTAPGSDELLASFLELEIDPVIHSMVAGELSYRASSNTVSYLVEIYSDESLSVPQRAGVLGVLSGITAMKATQGLHEALVTSEDPKLIMATALPLVRRGHGDSIRSIADWVDANQQREPEVAGALSAMIAQASHPKLEGAMRMISESIEHSLAVREAARKSLEEIALFSNAARGTPGE